MNKGNGLGPAEMWNRCTPLLAHHLQHTVVTNGTIQKQIGQWQQDSVWIFL